MKLSTIVISALFVAAPEIAFAGASWTEVYKGMGTDSDRDNACSSANSNAAMNAASACMVRRGFQGGQNDQGCSCQCNPFSGSQICTCTDTLVISCESNR